MTTDRSPVARRRFLKFLAASPYVASAGGVAAFLHEEGLAQETRQSVFANIVRDRTRIVDSPKEALTVFDLEETARTKVQPGHWAYMASGTDDDSTLWANREGFRQIQLRARRLRDATKVDMRVDLFGTTYDSPIFTCPTGGQGSMHEDAELGVARATRARNTMQMLSTSTGIAPEEVIKAHGRPVWQQFYAPSNWEACAQMLKRLEAAGISVIALTVDNTTGRFSETFLRTRPRDLKQCEACHKGGFEEGRHRPMLEGVDLRGGRRTNPAMDWKFVERLRNYWKGKFIVKGIETHEDAKLCLEHGLDGILVSNHGGRSTETGRGTIEALPEVVAAVGNRIPVFLDGGVRRGTDVFKALALGAKGVGIGRPMLWGLGAFGEAGVDRVLEILQAELKLVMGNCGTQKVADINPSYVITAQQRFGRGA
ncbi:MAG TPA: alpha-hydroxy acid oxidase [Burkholderiales bacterium]|nr:alpha-hydroxy acid oxidase [Burkholderiales bacterium]